MLRLSIRLQTLSRQNKADENVENWKNKWYFLFEDLTSNGAEDHIIG
jgi:hypothetical protein